MTPLSLIAAPAVPTQAGSGASLGSKGLVPFTLELADSSESPPGAAVDPVGEASLNPASETADESLPPMIAWLLDRFALVTESVQTRDEAAADCDGRQIGAATAGGDERMVWPDRPVHERDDAWGSRTELQLLGALTRSEAGTQAPARAQTGSLQSGERNPGLPSSHEAIESSDWMPSVSADRPLAPEQSVPKRRSADAAAAMYAPGPEVPAEARSHPAHHQLGIAEVNRDPGPALDRRPAVAMPAPLLLQADGADLGVDLGERISWLMQQGLGEATIELHPAELGALTIRIETQGQQAQVHILAAEPAARALLSQCLPQLRDLLGASGLTLTKGQVESAERRAATDSADGVGLAAPRRHRRVTSVTLVDTYV